MIYFGMETISVISMFIKGIYLMDWIYTNRLTPDQNKMTEALIFYVFTFCYKKCYANLSRKTCFCVISELEWLNFYNRNTLC